jgi:imidazoleglycerol phosphate synthase cyclase subunit
VRRVRAAIHIPLVVGGGVRSVSDAARLLAAGADRVSVNTAAVSNPTLLEELASAFGCQCVVLAVDAQQQQPSTDVIPRKWRVLTTGGRTNSGLPVIEWIRSATSAGAGEILLTSWDRDGTRAGADLELLHAASGAVSVPVIASGGIGNRQDIADALDAGADAVLAASIFHDGDDTVAGVKQWLAGRSYEVRRSSSPASTSCTAAPCSSGGGASSSSMAVIRSSASRNSGWRARSRSSTSTRPWDRDRTRPSSAG